MPLLRIIINLLCIPSDPIKGKKKDGVENRNQQKSDKCCYRGPADLRETERLPQRPALQGKRKKCQDGGSHGDHHWSNTLDTCVWQSPFKWLPLFVHLLDEVEQHDNMAYDHSDEAGHPEECHETKGRAHDRQGDQCSDRSIRCGGEDQQRLDGII